MSRGFAQVNVIWRMFCFCPLGLTCGFIGFQLIGAALSLDNYPSTSQHLDLFLTSQLNVQSSGCVTPVLLNHSASVGNQCSMWGSLKGPGIKQRDRYLNMDCVNSEPPFLHCKMGIITVPTFKSYCDRDAWVVQSVIICVRLRS